MKVKSESEVAQSCRTLRDPMDCSPPGSSVHGISQAGVLEWGAAALQLTLKQNLGYSIEIEERILLGIWDESRMSSGKWICL